MSLVTRGRHSYIGGHGAITAPVVIGNFCSIGPGVLMHERIQHPCTAHPFLASTSTDSHIPDYPKVALEQGITIGNDVWIGQGAVLMGAITIGDGAIIGAYAVVAKDIPPYAVAMGNPVQIKRYRFCDATIANLLRLAWWDWPDELIAQRAEELRDVGTLLEYYGDGPIITNYG